MKAPTLPQLLRNSLLQVGKLSKHIFSSPRALHVLLFGLTLFLLALLITSWMREWRFPPRVDQVFTCISIATLLAGFAALFLDVVNRMEKLGYLLLAASLTCLYWAERERDQFQFPAEVTTFINNQKIYPVAFLTGFWERLTSNVAAIREPAAAQARTLLLDKASSPQIAPLVADSLVAAAKHRTAGTGNDEEIRKTTAALVAIKDELPPSTKEYVDSKIKEAETTTITDAKSPITTPVESATAAPVEATQSNEVSASKNADSESKLQQLTENAVAFEKGKIEGQVEKNIDTSGISPSASSPTPADGAPVSNEVLDDAARPMGEIVDAANEAKPALPHNSENSDSAAIAKQRVVEAVVPKASSELSSNEAAAPNSLAPERPPEGTSEPTPSLPPPDPSKPRNIKQKETLDNAKSLKLEAELLLAIKVIEDIAKKTRDGEMPYAQLRELRLRLDSKKGGDLRNLAEPSKTRVLRKLDELDKRLKNEGKAQAHAKKHYAEKDLLRVGFLFPDETQRLNVRLAQIQLNRNAETSFYCPAIQNVGKKGNIPAATEIRYFEYSIFGWLRPRDAESHAAKLAVHLQRTVPGIGNVRTVYYKPERDDERPGNFEVWFSRGAFRR